MIPLTYKSINQMSKRTCDKFTATTRFKTHCCISITFIGTYFIEITSCLRKIDASIIRFLPFLMMAAKFNRSNTTNLQFSIFDLQFRPFRVGQGEAKNSENLYKMVEL